MSIYRIPPGASKLRQALALAEASLTPVLLYPDSKQPVGRDWVKGANRVPFLIKDRWALQPDGNVGIATGEQHHVHVLDVDVKNGARGLETIVRIAGPTWWERFPGYVRTPSGGYHIYFVYVPAWGNRKLGRYGLDVQGNGAQVVAPGMPGYTLPNGYLQVYAAPDDVLAAMAELYAEAHVVDRAGEVVELDPSWATDEVPELGPYLKRQRNVRAFMATGDSSAWNNDESTALFSVLVCLAGLKRDDLSDWLLTPSQALRIIVSNPHCYAVAEKRRGDNQQSAVQWLYRYNILKAFGGRGPSTWSDIDEQAKAGEPSEAWDPFAGPRVAGGGAAGLQSRLPPGGAESAPNPAGTPAALLSGGGGSGSGSDRGAGAGQPVTHAGLVAEAEDLPGRADMLERAQGILYRATEAELGPLHIDDLVQRVSSQGINRTALRKLLTQYGKQVAQERRAARMSTVKAGYAHHLRDYVYVPGHGFYSLLSGRHLSPSDFRVRHGSEAYDAFVEQGLGRKVEDLTFLPQNRWASGWVSLDPVIPDPDGRGIFVCNTWRPPTTRPAMDRIVNDFDVLPWLRLPTLAGVTPEHARELCDVLAYKAQHPSAKVNRGVLLGGAGGTGKSLFLHPLEVVFGHEGVVQVRQNVLDSEFDPDVSTACVMMIEEIASQSRATAKEGREVYNKLKPYTAAPPTRLSVVLKGKSAVGIPNQVLVCATTNYDDALVLDRDDRRWFMTWWERDPAAHTEQWGLDLVEWLREPQPGYDGHTGAELVAAWLLQRDVSGFEPGVQPTRTAWWHQCVEDSLSPTARALAWVLERDAVGRTVVGVEVLVDRVALTLMEHFGHMRAVTPASVGRAARELGMPVRKLNGPRHMGRRGPQKSVVVVDARKSRGMSGPELWHLGVEELRPVEGN